jgi:streptogramin lyase
MKPLRLTSLAGWAVGLSLMVGQAWGDTLLDVVGTGELGRDGDGGPAVQARLDNPFGVVRGPDQALWIADFSAHVVRRVAPDGTVSTVIGDGTAGYSGDGGPSQAARLNQPHELRFDRDGHLYLSDTANHVIRRRDARTGILTTIAGTGKPGYDGDGGPADRATLKLPISLQFSPGGDLFIADIGNHVIRRREAATGVLRTFAGTGKAGVTPDGAPLAGTPLNGPRSLDFDSGGNLWLVTREGNQLLKLDLPSGVYRHLAGTGAKGWTGDGGPARLATLAGPKGITVAPDGRVYLADTENHVIRRYDPVRLTLETVVGTGRKTNGPAGAPRHTGLARPHGVSIDRDGSLLIGDSENHRVRRYQP